MKISKVDTHMLQVPVKTPMLGTPDSVRVDLVVLHTDDNISGIGMWRDRESVAIGEVVRGTLAKFLISKNPLDTEWIWKEARWKLGQSFQVSTGVVAKAVSAVDQALWDIKGKYLRQPVFRLLGGAAVSSIEAYTTFGLAAFNCEQLTAFARQLVSEGHDKLKMRAMAANRGQDIEQDVERVRSVREAVGERVKIMLDGGNRFSPANALKLCKRIEPYDLTFFDEPVYAKDVKAMAELRRQTTVPLAARPKGDNIWDARDMIEARAVDVMQINVIDGGYTECVKMAHMAEMYQLPVATGGQYHLQNLHLIAGVTNGLMTEYHLLMAQAHEIIFVNPPKPQGGRLALSEKPGLGLELNHDAVKEYTEPLGA